MYVSKSLLAALSAEEERLWSIVTTNSLDFDAWTALIDETERMSEVCRMDSSFKFILILYMHDFIEIERCVCARYCVSDIALKFLLLDGVQGPSLLLV